MLNERRRPPGFADRGPSPRSASARLAASAASSSLSISVRPAFLVHRVVPRLDPVRRERPPAQRGGPPGVRTEPGGELFVVDRIAGQEGTGRCDVGVIHVFHSVSRRPPGHGLTYSTARAIGTRYRYSQFADDDLQRHRGIRAGAIGSRLYRVAKRAHQAEVVRLAWLLARFKQRLDEPSLRRLVEVRDDGPGRPRRLTPARAAPVR